MGTKKALWYFAEQHRAGSYRNDPFRGELDRLHALRRAAIAATKADVNLIINIWAQTQIGEFLQYVVNSGTAYHV